MRNQWVAGFTVALFGLSGVALAKVSDSEAQQLGNELTPVGAEQQGNASGSIPAWTGGLTKPPAGWKPGPDVPGCYLVCWTIRVLHEDEGTSGKAISKHFARPASQNTLTNLPKTDFTVPNALASSQCSGRSQRSAPVKHPFPVPFDGCAFHGLADYCSGWKRGDKNF